MTGNAKRSVLRRDMYISLVLGPVTLFFIGVFFERDHVIAGFIPMPVAIVTRILLDPYYVKRTEAYERQHPPSRD